MKENILSFDFGLKKIGVAIGHYLTFARPLPEIKAINGIPNWFFIEKILKEWEPKIAIVGLPLNMDGTNQLMTFKAKKFAKSLKNFFKLQVQMCDERLTTREAYTNYFKNNVKVRIFKKNHLNLHSFAAVIILNSWLNNMKKF